MPAEGQSVSLLVFLFCGNTESERRGNWRGADILFFSRPPGGLRLSTVRRLSSFVTFEAEEMDGDMEKDHRAGIKMYAYDTGHFRIFAD